MLQSVILFFLGLVAQNLCSLSETAEQGKRCDKKSLLTIRTECQSCSVSLGMKCPDGFTKITSGIAGIRDCRYTFEVRAYSLSLPGCRHICSKDYLQPQCCPGHWGPDCMECPGGAKSPCSGRGHCAEGMEGNGSCLCQEGFSGTACEICADDNVFGPNCSAVCSCVHGVCNSGIHGDGSCECYSGYTGRNCDERECCSFLDSSGFPGGSDDKESTLNAGDLGLIPGSGGSPGEGNGSPLQYSCLENSLDGGTWGAIVHEVAKNRTSLND